MRKLTLIGGAPVSGKTTLSQQIAQRDDAVELSSDSVRAWMKQLVTEEDYPGLFYTDGMTAVEFYEKFTTPQAVVDSEIQQGTQVQKGILALLNTAITWQHLVLEGIALSPNFMERVVALYPNIDVECIVLVDQNKERIHQRIGSRGLWGPLDTYPGELIPKEVEWVVLYNEWFREEANKYGIDVRYNESS